MSNEYEELKKLTVKGEGLKIIIEGVDTKEFDHFGGLNLHVKAVREIISQTDSRFAQESDPDIDSKIIALYLNEIGEFIRSLTESFRDYDDETNIDILKEFMDYKLGEPAIQELLKKDNKGLTKRREEAF